MNDTQENTPTPPTPSGFDLGIVIQQAKQVISDPTGFYKSMQTTGGLAEPAIFVAVMGFAAGVIGAILSLLGGGLGGIAGILIMPIAAVIGSFVAALIMFVIWKLMGSDRDYETAYRCLSASTALYPVAVLLSIIPYLGAMLAAAWGMYLMYIASLHIHKIKEETARLVIGILALLSVVSQCSAQSAARQAEVRAAEVEEAAESMSDAYAGALGELENIEDMTPEEAGRKFGEFVKGMSEGMEEFEKGVQEGMEKSN